MIELTRLNGSPLFVNCDLVKLAESAPDTMLTLINGEKIVVREPCAEVVRRMTVQRVRLLAAVVGFAANAETVARAAGAAAVPGYQPERRDAENTRVDLRHSHSDETGGTA